MPDSVVIAGSLAQKPMQGGHTWQFLQYILGFKRLGWDVLFVDRLEPGMCVDDRGRPVSFGDSVNLRYFNTVMRCFGLEDDYALIYNGGEHIAGQSRAQILNHTRKAAFLLNVMGYLADEEILAAARRRVFLDTDPGYGQMWHELGLARIFEGYEAYVTIAENIGRPECDIPTCGIDWITWRQPVVLDQWPSATCELRELFTSIGSWRGPYGPIEYGGRTYGLRAHEFRKFAGLPRLSARHFEAALDIDAAEVDDLRLLRENHWSLSDPRVVARDPWAYRDYVRGSMAEFMVARNMYVDSKCGWFSERSICYLASGRPVLAQDTGIRHLLPTGEGLVTFATLEEAVAGVEEFYRNYNRHARAARDLAEAYFDSDKVLTNLLAKLDAGSPPRRESGP
ncbi:MAG: hypothetical protein GEU28_03030 [Dehalococcoidia bacterium]|nr:hypothetical protein [Dehalococcoidia bacterium]